MNHSQPEAGPDTVAFASILSGAYASAAVALLFLGIDALRGDPFFTPSLMGSVMLLGSTPSAELPVRLDMVAYYSLLHVALFASIGTVFTLAGLRFARFLRSFLAFVASVYATLTLGMVGLDSLFFPGLIGTIGLIPLAVANLGAAAVMSVFIRSTLDSVVPGDVVGRSIEAVSPVA